MIAGPFPIQNAGVAPDISRTPKQEMIGWPWRNLVVRQFCYLKPKLPQPGILDPFPQTW